MNKWKLRSVLVAVLLAPAMAHAQPIPAFPGAEGAGAFATGGRPKTIRGKLEGIVYHVTNLDPDPTGSLPGSLRYGMRDENFRVSVLSNGQIFPESPNTFDIMPRIIVFDVGGTIVLNNLVSNSDIDMTPRNFTIAGQTAPGGITIYGAEFNPGHRESWDTDGSPTKTNNLIIRNLTVRTHNANEKDAFWVPLSNSIVDHVSGSWHTDEGVSITDSARDITVQYSIVGPGWNNPDGDGSQIEGKTPAANISVHHNLYLHNDARIVRVGEKTATTGGPGVELDFRNNVIYNWNDSRAGYGVSGENSFTNFVNNYYIGGAGTSSTTIFNVPSGTAGQTHRIYQSGNLMDQNKNGTPDGVVGTSDMSGWQFFTGNEAQQGSPYVVPHGVTQTPAEALDSVRQYAGANWRDRDFLDQRSINQLLTYGNSSLPVSQRGQVLSTIDPADVTAVVGAPMQTHLAGYDDDNDGMEGQWELKHGLNPNSAPGSLEWRGDFDNDGYLNIEEYINELAEWPAPFDIVWNGGTSRYAQIQNWSITRSSPGEANTTTNWQPSKYDVAVINNGTVTVDAVGQHAGTIRLATGATDNATLNITSGWLEVEDEMFGPGNGEVIIGAHPTATAALNLSGGRLVAETLSKNAGSTFSFTGGTLVAGTVGFTLENDGGIITPGSSAGQMHVTGDLVLDSGTLIIEIGGTDPEDYDRILVDGVSTLGGKLFVTFIDPLGGENAFTPALGNEFEFLTSDGGTADMFENIQLPEPGPGLAWEFKIGSITSLKVVEAVTALPGDFNNSGVVDAADYTLWRNHVGEGDETNISFNGNGDGIDDSDYELWKEHYGEINIVFVGGGGLAAVPEPGTAVLMLATVAAMACGRRAVRRVY